ncbi:hypothetical protein BJ508DRAFT_321390 [Ascobolus immersus RN42]|uniref:Uncharacterized protein n=1 Tax=Ascobolus immersus RN42 TaxID=1160509 RepID=A0A3N4ILQ3_ASCIM|nr:hypothetical protein BJ508DRAFT_321390 [Ascobolus immersus RN42]
MADSPGRSDLERQSEELIAHLKRNTFRNMNRNPDTNPRLLLEVAPKHPTGAECAKKACDFFRPQRNRYIKPGSYRVCLNPGTVLVNPETGQLADEHYHLECLERLLVLSAPGIVNKMTINLPTDLLSHSTKDLGIVARLKFLGWREQNIKEWTDNKRRWLKKKGPPVRAGIKRTHDEMNAPAWDTTDAIMAGKLNLLSNFWWEDETRIRETEREAKLHVSPCIASSARHELSKMLGTIGVEKGFHFRADAEELKKSGKSFSEVEGEAGKKLLRMMVEMKILKVLPEDQDALMRILL